jgi:hypothetical protein
MMMMMIIKEMVVVVMMIIIITEMVVVVMMMMMIKEMMMMMIIVLLPVTGFEFTWFSNSSIAVSEHHRSVRHRPDGICMAPEHVCLLRPKCHSSQAEKDKSCLHKSPDRPFGPRNVRAPRISRQSAHEGGKVVSPTQRSSLPPGDSPGTHFS